MKRVLLFRIAAALLTAAAVALGQPALTTTPGSLTFTIRVDAGETAVAPFFILNTGAATPFRIETSTETGANWLSVDQTSGTAGTTPKQVNAQANRHGLQPGQYLGNIDVIPTGGTPVRVRAALNVCNVPNGPLDPCFPGPTLPGSPGVKVSPEALSFIVVRGTSASTLTVKVFDSGSPQDITVQASTKTGADWLSTSASRIRTPAGLDVIAAGQNLAAGNYDGVVTLTPAIGSAIPIPVRMRVLDPPPVVTAIDPSFVPAPSPDTTFTITGQGFKAGAQVQLTISTPQVANADVLVPNAPTVVDARTLRIVIPGTFLIQPGFLMVRVLNPDAVPSDPLKLTVGRPVPEMRPNGTNNSASLTGDRIAPGELLTIFGAALGPAQPGKGDIDQAGALSRQVAGVRVLFDSEPGGLLYVSDTQINAVAPNSIANRAETEIVVEYNGNRSTATRLPVAAAVPGIFTESSGRGQVILVRGITPAKGADLGVTAGDIVTFYATGAGVMQNSAGDAMLAKDVLKPLLPVSVRIGGQEAEVLYAGTSPGQLEAVLQLNVRIPVGIAPGSDVPVELIVGSEHSQSGVTIVVK